MRGRSSAVLSSVNSLVASRKTHWFHTIVITRAELDKVFNNTAMRKRSVIPSGVGPELTILQHISIRHPRHVPV